MTPICDVIVLTWNQLEVTKNCVQSFLASTPLPVRLIIIDNQSTDGTKAYLASLKNTSTCYFQIIFNEENKGFIKGVNQGLLFAQAPFICLANNDLIFTKGWLEEVLTVFEKNPEVGLLNPNSNNLGLRPSKGVEGDLEGFARELLAQEHQGFVEYSACIGFCMVFRQEVVLKVGQLSEEFLPMFFEDTDYSRRVFQAGYRLGVAKGAYVWHQEHASVDQLGPEKEALFVQSRTRYYAKWGRPLRIGWIVTSYQELLDSMPEAIDLVRQENTVYFLLENFSVDYDKVFQESDAVPIACLEFVPCKNNTDISWKVLFKKKKHDMIITKNNLLKNVFKAFGRPVYKNLEKNVINNLKGGTNNAFRSDVKTAAIDRPGQSAATEV